MGTTMKTAGGPRQAGALELAEKLLQRVALELEHADRPLARAAADRCLAQLIEACERIDRCREERSGERDELAHARRSLRASAHALGLVHRCGAILPSAYQSLRAGFAVLARRIGGDDALAGARPTQH